MKVNVNNGLGDIYDKINGHPKQAEVEADIMKQYETRPGLAMVDSNADITNLHVPSDVIIDASMSKHVEQFLKEGHLRWDSLGEYLATAIGFQELGARTNSANSTLLGDTMMNAVGKWLENNKSPGRKVKQLDNRGANFYVALYWAEELAAKDAAWAPLAQALKENEEQIVKASTFSQL